MDFGAVDYPKSIHPHEAPPPARRNALKTVKPEFEVRERKPRKARNPRTGEKVKVPAKRVVTFKPGREMEERVGQLKKVPSWDQ